MTRNYRISMLYALMASLLFGSSAPVAKLMLGSIEPVMLASLLYFGSGFGLFLMSAFGLLMGGKRNQYEAALTRQDLPWLAGIVLFGGVLAPITLMVSLPYTPAATAALLLNFEAVATSLIAAVWFREGTGARIWVALALITISSVILTLRTDGSLSISIAALGVLLTTVFWAMDNNISRNISAKDPIPTVMYKGVFAGVVSLAVALCIGEAFPEPQTCMIAMAIGFFSYGGITSVFFMMALRGVGASRTGSLLAISPFFGVILSLLFFAEKPGLQFYASLPIMAIGAYLLVTERHAHTHYHPSLVHEHRHRHDDAHHEHDHTGDEPPLSPSGEHSHIHSHEEIWHEHHHSPDIHHMHRHENGDGILYRLHTNMQQLRK